MEANGDRKGKNSRLLTTSGIVATATLFAYVFGSLYIERYYRYFGVPSSALDLGSRDYVSHSLLPLFVAAQLGLWAELLYYNITHNYFLGFNLTRVSQIQKKLETERQLSFVNLVRAIYRDDPSDSRMNVFMLLTGGVDSVAWVAYVVSSHVAGKPVEGILVASVFSFAIGVLYFVSNQITKFVFSQTYRDFPPVQLVGSLLSIVVIYMAAIGLIANMQASYDLDRLPEAVVASKAQLPSEITELSGTPNVSKAVRVLTINGGRMYVYSEAGSGEHAVYALDYPSVVYVRYVSNAGARSPQIGPGNGEGDSR